MCNHSQHAHSLNEMVARANNHATKTITWTTEGLQGFEELKAMVNACTELNFINNVYKVVLYTDASDYAHGAYLCQITQTGRGNERGPNKIPWLILWSSSSMVDDRKRSLCNLLALGLTDY